MGFMALLAAATAGYTYVLKMVVDTIGGFDANGTPGQDLSQTQNSLSQTSHFIFKIVPLIMGVTLISALSLFLQVILSNSVALNVVGDLQKHMFASLQNADFVRFQKDATGHIVSRFTNDVNLVSQALLRTLNNLVRDVLKIMFLIAVMLYYDWQVTALVLLIYPLAIYPIIKISKMIRGTSHAAQDQIGEITAQLSESLNGARMIRAYGLEAHETTRLNQAFDRRIRLYLKLVTDKARVDPIFEVLGGLAIAGVLIFGIWRVEHTPDFTGTSYGDLVGILAALGLIAPPIRALGTLNNVVQEGLAAVSRIFEIIDTRPDITDTPQALTLKDPLGHIAFKKVSFQYADATHALTDISFEAKPGTRIALVGPSGGGKSTLINLLPRLYDVSAGAIEIDGVNIDKFSLESLRASMALVSQDVTLFEDSIAANIGFGDLSASRDDIIAAAKAADAHDFITRLGAGYDTILGQDGQTLSGGQRQRLSIARAVLRDAPILLLDEATSALDSQSEHNVQAAIDRLSHGRTTLIIAHRLSTIKCADMIHVMENGRIVESGTHKKLIAKRNGIYAKLKTLQS